jgi:hypothetical protein
MSAPGKPTVMMGFGKPSIIVQDEIGKTTFEQ